MGKKTIEVKKIGNMLLINGEMYEPIYQGGNPKEEFIKFRKIDRRKFDKLREAISNKLKDKLKSKDVIENALADMDLKSLERIEKHLKAKKPKVKKRLGCYEMVVGKDIIPIR